MHNVNWRETIVSTNRDWMRAAINFSSTSFIVCQSVNVSVMNCIPNLISHSNPNYKATNNFGFFFLFSFMSSFSNLFESNSKNHFYYFSIPFEWIRRNQCRQYCSKEAFIWCQFCLRCPMHRSHVLDERRLSFGHQVCNWELNNGIVVIIIGSFNRTGWNSMGENGGMEGGWVKSSQHTWSTS